MKSIILALLLFAGQARAFEVDLVFDIPLKHAGEFQRILIYDPVTDAGSRTTVFGFNARFNFERGGRFIARWEVWDYERGFFSPRAEDPFGEDVEIVIDLERPQDHDTISLSPTGYITFWEPSFAGRGAGSESLVLVERRKIPDRITAGKGKETPPMKYHWEDIARVKLDVPVGSKITLGLLPRYVPGVGTVEYRYTFTTSLPGTLIPAG